MITFSSAPTVNRLKKTGTILANNKVYTSPSMRDKTWDICYKFDYPFNVLCNFTNSRFTHQGVKINSMEGFLQSTKVADKKVQEKICTLPGFLAKKVGNYLKKSGKFDRVTVFWKGQKYDRNSKEFAQVVADAYASKHSQDRVFRGVLEQTKGKTLTHTIGKSDPMDTVLTEAEFIDHLNYLRGKSSLKDRIKNFFIDLKNFLFPAKNTKTIADRFKDHNATFVNDIYVCGENPMGDMKALRKSGVKNIIDTTANPKEAEERGKLATEYGLTYMNIMLDNHKKLLTPEETTKQIVELYNGSKPTYIITKERKDANIVFGVNYLYNPKALLPDALMFGSPQKSFLSRIMSAENYFTREDKKSLGWTKDFEMKLQDRKNDIMEINA